MDEELKIALLESPEVQELLADWKTDLPELLRKEGEIVKRGSLPNVTLSDGTKEPVSVIIASAALAAALTPLLSRALSKLTSRPILIEEKVLVPVEDGTGAMVKDSSGNPICYWKTKKTVKELRKEDDFAVQIKGHGIEISLG